MSAIFEGNPPPRPSMFFGGKPVLYSGVYTYRWSYEIEMVCTNTEKSFKRLTIFRNKNVHTTYVPNPDFGWNEKLRGALQYVFELAAGIMNELDVGEINDFLCTVNKIALELSSTLST